MAKATKMQRIKLERLNAAISRLNDEIYAVALPRRDIPFAECMKIAPKALVEARYKALTALLDFEASLIAQGRAWRGKDYNILFLN